jgi:hypothetical protein
MMQTTPENLAECARAQDLVSKAIAEGAQPAIFFQALISIGTSMLADLVNLDYAERVLATQVAMLRSTHAKEHAAAKADDQAAPPAKH